MRHFYLTVAVILSIARLTIASPSPVYEMSSSSLDTSDNVTIEAWIQPAPDCPPNAVIVDKWGPGSQVGYRLIIGKDRTVQFFTTAPTPCATASPLPSDQPTQVVATFSPRNKVFAVYLDGKPAANIPLNDRRLDPPHTSTPLRIGADQDGNNPFIGSISRVVVFSRDLSPSDVEDTFKNKLSKSGLIGDWDLSSSNGEHQITPTAGSATLIFPVTITPATTTPNPLELWYTRPAREWVEALPLGNGRLGAMVFGGVDRERLQLNEDTIWAGGPYDPANPAAFDAFAKARELIFAGKAADADPLLRASGMGNPPNQASYQPLGNLYLTDASTSAEPATEYRRSLDLETGVAKTTWRRAGVTFTREAFSSAPDQILVVRITADRPGKINLAATMDSPCQSMSAVDGDDLLLTGVSGKHANIAGQVKFEAIARPIVEGGTLKSDKQSLQITGANAVTFLLAGRTNYVNYHDLSADPHELAQADLKSAAAYSFDELKSRHIADYQALFHRVTLDLGAAPADTFKLPTDERLKRFGSGNDPQLAALFFQYGRYLLICSSRPGTQPATLQGLWNDTTSPPWNSKYTININTEMNYWPAEPTNLSECAKPLFQLIDDISHTGRKTAEVMYHAHGWVCNHNTDGWRATAPIDYPSTGIWPVGGAWLCTHLWQHYLFTGNKDQLAHDYPILKGACQFFLDTLVEEPKHHWLVTCPSVSPEHGGLVAGPTMDMSILRDLFQETADASAFLGLDADFRAQILETREHLAPFQIGKYGQLQEWLDDIDRKTDSHRHQSHLYGLFPSAQITPETPNLFEAAKNSLIGRGDAATGWSLAWKINLWARELDGNHAFLLITHLLRPPATGTAENAGERGGGTYPNLFDAHPPFQIDGNFGATSGITEMLLQSHEPFIRLLPALPDNWPAGQVTGLCARGGFVVGLTWSNHKLTFAKIISRLGNRCRIHAASLTVTENGKPIPTREDGQGICSFDTKPNAVYTVTIEP
jgi:alpha-L-fucosidase 2